MSRRLVDQKETFGTVRSSEGYRHNKISGRYMGDDEERQRGKEGNKRRRGGKNDYAGKVDCQPRGGSRQKLKFAEAGTKSDGR
jgi:hypothetical protein